VVRAAEVVGCEQSSGTFVQVLGETADLRASFSASVKRIEPLESGGCAKPDIAGGRYEPWAGDIAELAKSPNVVCKFSGLLNCAPPGADQDKLRPYADHVLSSFGTDRVVWASATGRRSTSWRATSAGTTSAVLYSLALPRRIGP
jgi:hypothetical protein